jgi:hypothetical protein
LIVARSRGANGLTNKIDYDGSSPLPPEGAFLLQTTIYYTMEDPMGKKRRYRKFPQKFGRKYATKYGLNKSQETSTEVTHNTPEPVIMAAPEPLVEKPVVMAAPEPATITATADPIVEALEADTKEKHDT